MNPQPQASIHLEDAAYLSQPSRFSLMLKPIGAQCNLGCRYCYYSETGGAGPRMTLPVLEAAVRSFAQTTQAPELQFIWHGGEPLLMGLDFFQKAVELELRYAGDKAVFNSIQTNGTLLSPAWAAFFRDHHFLVGLSIDGPQDLHDRYRLDRGGQPTFQRVLAGLKMLQDAGVQYNTLTTVNHASEGRGAEVYAFLKSLGCQYMQFLPVLEFGPAAGTSVSGTAFGRFMADIFDVWIRQDVGRHFVQLFDAALAAWCGLPPGLCTLGRRCEGTVVVEHNGDVYACDHAVHPGSRIGNLMETPLQELMKREAFEHFAARKTASLPRRCLSCPWLPACNGECPQHRSAADGRNGLCDGYRLFFEHAAPALDRMRALLAAGRAPAEISQLLDPSAQ